MATERFANDIQTTLTANVAPGDSVIPVASGTGFPASPQFRLRVDNEIMLVTGGVGTTNWDVTRGAENSTAASHTSGTVVVHVLTAGALGVVSDPAAGVPGLRTLGTGATQAAAGNDSRFAAIGGSGSLLERTLTNSPTVGATSLTINSAAPFAALQGLIVIDPFTVQCEIRRVSAVSPDKLTLTIPALTFGHASGDNVFFVADDFDFPVQFWGQIAGSDSTAAIQAALDASRPSGVGKTLHFPAGSYRIDGTVTVGSGTKLQGDGGDQDVGTQFFSTTNTKMFDLRSTSLPASVKDATRVVFEGIQFVKTNGSGSSLTTTAYCIDADASDMCWFRDVVFGNNTTLGCMNGISLSGTGVTYLDKCRFIGIGTQGLSSGDNAAIKVTSSSDVLNVTDCQFERNSKILLTDVHAARFQGCHLEVSSLELHNCSHNSFVDITPTSSDIKLDNKSNNNRFDNCSGAASRLIDFGSNYYRNCIGFNNVGRTVRSWGPFNGENSPIQPSRAATATQWDSDPAVAYGTAGDNVLFAVTVMSAVNGSSTTGTIVFRDTGGGTVHTSPSITVGHLGSPGPAATTQSRNMETYTYWAMMTVPASQQIYIQSPFVCSVWASKVVNPDPFLDATTNWSAAAPLPNHGALASVTPSMTGGTTYGVAPSGASYGNWFVIQYSAWPTPIASRYLMVLRGRWDDATQAMAMSDNQASDALDLARVRSNWLSGAGDAAFNLQTATDKMLFAIVQPGLTTGRGGTSVTNQKFMAVSFGGYSAGFTTTTRIEIDWCAIVPL